MTEDEQGSPWRAHAHRTGLFSPGSSRHHQGQASGQRGVSLTHLRQAWDEKPCSGTWAFQTLLSVRLHVCLKRLGPACPPASQLRPCTCLYLGAQSKRTCSPCDINTTRTAAHVCTDGRHLKHKCYGTQKWQTHSVHSVHSQCSVKSPDTILMIWETYCPLCGPRPPLPGPCGQRPVGLRAKRPMTAASYVWKTL